MSKKVRGKNRRGHGEGSVAKRKDGRWQASILVGYSPETGRPQRKYFYGTSQKEVQDKLRGVAQDLQAGTYRKPSNLTLAKWFEKWLEVYAKHTLRASTWQNYTYQINAHIVPHLGQIKLKDLTALHIQEFLNSKLAEGRTDGKPGGLAGCSVKVIHSIIHSSLEQAKEAGLIANNPACAARSPAKKTASKEVAFLDAEEVSIFLAAAKESKHFSAYFLALNTGLRRGELLGLRWQDVDLDAGQLVVSQSLARVPARGLVFQPPKTSLSRRIVALPPVVVERLREHRREQAINRLRVGSAYNSAFDLVFCNELGEAICPTAFSMYFKRLAGSVGLDVTLHGLRHTFATLALQQGADAKTISQTLGHHSTAFTLDIYGKVTDTMRREAADRVGDLVASLM